MEADGESDGRCGACRRREDARVSEQMKILIAYDGSECADAALADLQRAGLPPAAAALIMSVAEVFLPPASSLPPAFPAQVPAAVQRPGCRPLRRWTTHARWRSTPVPIS